MWRELLQQGKDVIQQFCRRLRGADRRAFQAEVAAEVCGESPRRAESMFGWCRQAVQKGLIELEYQVDLLPHFARRGRRHAWRDQFLAQDAWDIRGLPN